MVKSWCSARSIRINYSEENQEVERPSGKIQALSDSPPGYFLWETISDPKRREYMSYSFRITDIHLIFTEWCCFCVFKQLLFIYSVNSMRSYSILPLLQDTAHELSWQASDWSIREQRLEQGSVHSQMNKWKESRPTCAGINWTSWATWQDAIILAKTEVEAKSPL